MNFQPKNINVWAEIPVTNLDKSIKFFQEVLMTEMRMCTEGPQPIAVFPTEEENGVAGHLYEGTPAVDGKGTRVHLACPDSLENSMERVKKAGGKVVSEIITIPSGRFAYCSDLDGNSFGLFSEAA